MFTTVRRSCKCSFKKAVITKKMHVDIRDHLALNSQLYDTYDKQKAQIISYLNSKKKQSAEAKKKHEEKQPRKKKDENAMEIDAIWGWKGKGGKDKGKGGGKKGGKKYGVKSSPAFDKNKGKGKGKQKKGGKNDGGGYQGWRSWRGWKIPNVSRKL